jgi:heme/copper-type cytochrome/quinol oxidase subunit 3
MIESFRQRDFRPPPGAFRVGMWVFLISLAMLFASSLLGYALVRFNGPLAPRPGTVATPTIFWWSTALLLVGGYFLSAALCDVTRERLVPFRRKMLTATILCLGFLVLQGPAVVELLKNHEQAEMKADPIPKGNLSPDQQEYIRAHQQAPPRSAQLYALVFTLVVLHGLHVFAGVPPLILTTMRAYAGKYDHEVYQGVAMCVMYWHFLDAVWIIMFATFLVIG